MTERNTSRNPPPLKIDPTVPLTSSPRPPPKNSSVTGTTPSSTGASASSTSSFPMTSLDTTTSMQTSIASGATQRSPGAKPEGIFTHLQQPDTAVSSESQAFTQLLSRMGQVIGAVHTTCDLLEKSTKFAVAAGPAIKAAEEASLKKLRHDLQQQKTQYEAQFQLLKGSLSEQLEDAIKGVLRNQALELVKKRVRGEISNSVSEQLRLQIPPQLLTQNEMHMSQMLEVNTSVHNSESRARNISIRGATDSLHQLWLPSDSKPHPRFPSTVRALADKSNDEIEALLQAYNIAMPPLRSQSTDKRPVIFTREEKINYFLNFIGVTLRVVPKPPTTTKEGKKLTSTLVISACQ
ncbi:hypothetical protein EV368DRAFT_60648 [Lentinula lateritia]|uniref:Uncharacterized protein n=1 Tax=Lentinula aff. lateritia TaxID=2804960 RepID=A0ACC1U1X9_9AGAR|nr:hypothetical protein F5876DRAFT_65290 [Lentinula aff. lateritia]KAJ3857748.1 hypothetical protein EV368DRAFT_60648 [Lentinula lateritia]